MALALDDKTNLSTASDWVISSATYQKKKEKKKLGHFKCCVE